MLKKKKKIFKKRFEKKILWDYTFNNKNTKSFSKNVEGIKKVLIVLDKNKTLLNLNYIINFLENSTLPTLENSILYINLKNKLKNNELYKNNKNENNWYLSNLQQGTLTNYKQNIEFTNKKSDFIIQNFNKMKIKIPQVSVLVNFNKIAEKEIRNFNMPLIAFLKPNQILNNTLYHITLGDSKRLRNIFFKFIYNQLSFIKKNNYLKIMNKKKNNQKTLKIFSNKKYFYKFQIKLIKNSKKYTKYLNKNFKLFKRRMQIRNILLQDILDKNIVIRKKLYLNFVKRHIWKPWKHRNKVVFENRERLKTIKFKQIKKWKILSKKNINKIWNLRLLKSRSRLFYKKTNFKLSNIKSWNLSSITKNITINNKITKNKKVKIYTSKKLFKKQFFKSNFSFYFNKQKFNKIKKLYLLKNFNIENTNFKRLKLNQFKYNNYFKITINNKIITKRKKKKITKFNINIIQKKWNYKIKKEKNLIKKKRIIAIKKLVIKIGNFKTNQRYFSTFFNIKKNNFFGNIKNKIIVTKLKKNIFKYTLFKNKFNKKTNKFKNIGKKVWLEAKLRYEKQKKYHIWKKKNLKRKNKQKRKFTVFKINKDLQKDIINKNKKNQENNEISKIQLLTKLNLKKIHNSVDTEKNNEKNKLNNIKTKTHKDIETNIELKKKYIEMFDWKRNLYNKETNYLEEFINKKIWRWKRKNKKIK